MWRLRARARAFWEFIDVLTAVSYADNEAEFLSARGGGERETGEKEEEQDELDN